MPLPQSTMSAFLYCHIGGESSTGSFDMSFTLIAAYWSSMASMPGASSQPHVAARQLLKHCSSPCRPVAKLLIFTGCTLMDHGMDASSGSLGPGLTDWLCCTSAGAGRAFEAQPTA